MSSMQRRGISQVIGSLLMLAIVVPLGSIILFNGTTEITAFNNEMSNSLEFRNNGIQEDLVFEHIRFDPSTKNVMIPLFLNSKEFDISLLKAVISVVPLKRI